MSTNDSGDPLDDPFADDEDDEMFRRRERGHDKNRPVIAELVRRAIEGTVGQVQSSGAVGRDALGYLLQQGDKGKRELVRIVAKEVGDFLRATDISQEAVKILTGVRVDLNASISFKATDDGRGARPEVDASSVSVKDRTGRDVLAESDDDSQDLPTSDVDEDGIAH